VTLSVSSTYVDAMLQGMVTALDTPMLEPTLYFYAGERPGPGGAPEANALVASVRLLRPSGTVGGGALTLAVPSYTGIALRAATPTWARLVDGAGSRVMDLTCRLIGAAENPLDPAEVVIDAPSVTVSTRMRVVSGAIQITG
jgi:hypothetical protein